MILHVWSTYNIFGYPNVRRNDGCCGRIKCNDRGAGGGINTTEGGGDVSHPVAVVGGAVLGAKGSARHTHRVVWSPGCAQLAQLAVKRYDSGNDGSGGHTGCEDQHPLVGIRPA